MLTKKDLSILAQYIDTSVSLIAATQVSYSEFIAYLTHLHEKGRLSDDVFKQLEPHLDYIKHSLRNPARVWKLICGILGFELSDLEKK